MLRTQEIGYFHLPVGYPKPASDVPVTKQDVQKWIRENSPSFFQKTSYGTYLGIIGILAGAVASIAGLFKENKFLKWIGGILAGVGAVTSAIGKLFGVEVDVLNKVHSKVLFSPNGKVETTPDEEGIDHEKVEIKTNDGETLKGFFLPAPVPTKKTVIFLNGQGYNASMLLKEKKFEKLQSEVPVNVLIVDYRGFGESTGSATPQGVVNDAVSMYDYLVSEKHLTPNDISIFGVSLGGAVAIELANKREVDTLIVQSSFTTVEDVADDKLPKVIPAFLRGLLKGITQSEFNSRESIKNVKAKKVIISHGTDDDVIPVKHGEELFGLLNVPEKYFMPIEGARHKDFAEGYDEGCYELFRKCLGVSKIQIDGRRQEVLAAN